MQGPCHINAFIFNNGFIFNMIVCRSSTVQEGSRDGEGVERLRPFLCRFSSLTKEMSAHKRTDVLTDGLHYAQHLLFTRCIEKQHNDLHACYMIIAIHVFTCTRL